MPDSQLRVFFRVDDTRINTGDSDALLPETYRRNWNGFLRIAIVSVTSGAMPNPFVLMAFCELCQRIERALLIAFLSCGSRPVFLDKGPYFDRGRPPAQPPKHSIGHRSSPSTGPRSLGGSLLRVLAGIYIRPNYGRLTDYFRGQED